MSTYLITGAAGYIGSMLIERLLADESAPQVIALVRDLERAGMPSSDARLPGKKERTKAGQSQGQDPSRDQDLSQRQGPGQGSASGCIRWLQGDLRDVRLMDRICQETGPIDYILHCAAVTRSSEMAAHPVEVIQSIVNATQNVLELARRCRIESMVYLSSMEVYGSVDCPEGRRVAELEAGSGRVELLNVRSCYPLGKRMAENICYCYFREYGVPVKIARLAQTFGRGVLPEDERVFAQLGRAVKSGEDIRLHTAGRSMGNYCGIDDALTGILTILERGQNGEAYNVVNEGNTMTIRQMAELVAGQLAEGRIGVRYERLGDKGDRYAADTGLRLSGEKLSRLGWQPMEDLMDMYREMLKEL